MQISTEYREFTPVGTPLNQQRDLGGSFRGQAGGPESGRTFLALGVLLIAMGCQRSHWVSLGLMALVCHLGACGSKQSSSSEIQNSVQQGVRKGFSWYRLWVQRTQVVLSIFFTVSYSSGWPPIHYLAENGLGFLLPPSCAHYHVWLVYLLF